MTCAQKQQMEPQLETHQGVNTKVYDPWMDLFLSDEDRTLLSEKQNLWSDDVIRKIKNRWLVSSLTHGNWFLWLFSSHVGISVRGTKSVKLGLVQKPDELYILPESDKWLLASQRSP